jgi:hypothetical protein
MSVGESAVPARLGLKAAALARVAFDTVSSVSDAQDREQLVATCPSCYIHPVGAPRLPRPPTVPRSVAQVGLGTARNFTTGRPIFQSIADKIYNIPVTGRAFLQADLDMRMKDDHALVFKRKEASATHKESKRRSGAESLALTSCKVPSCPATTHTTTDSVQADFDKHFAPLQTSDISTTLLIPLAPTPTARVPLAHSLACDRHPLIPFAELSALHIDMERHASRVKVLFEQLDAAQVWDEGATCEALCGARGAGILHVRFSGWPAYAVRGILGEAATGWCILEEERREEVEDEDDLDAAMSDVEVGSAQDCSGLAELNLSSPIDPAFSFVLPMLDVSASSTIASVTPPAPAGRASSASAAAAPFSDLASNVSSSDFEIFSDPGSISDSLGSDDSGSHGWIEPPDALHSSRAPSWAGLSFSSAFCQRLEEGPQEAIF